MDSPVITSENKAKRDKNGRLLPGNTANPHGRPKGSLSVTALIKEKLQEVAKGHKKTYAELLVDEVVKRALKGDNQMVRQIWSYVDGMPKKQLDVDINKNGLEELTEFLKEMAKPKL